MCILALKDETFDNILTKCHQQEKQLTIQYLERLDQEIAARLNKKRWELIRIDKRTILSSFGIITFKHRYYYDKFLKERIYPLDNLLGVPKNTRITNELRLRILDLASIMSYREVGTHISSEFELSKSTIFRIVKDTVIEQCFDSLINRGNLKIHVQIDEKFIGMTNSKNKKRYYTLTIFAGKEMVENSKRNRLLNKTVLSSSVLKDLKVKLNEILRSRYKVKPDEEIFVSGDMANYIQNFKDDIMVCKARYVPDKFHAYQAIKDSLPEVYIDDISLNDVGFQRYLYKQLALIYEVDAIKIRGLMKRNPKCFESYLDKEYLGCSQEGQNSHIYAPRFGKYANRFNPDTIEKLSLVREGVINKSKIIVGSKTRRSPELSDFRLYDLPALEERIKYVLDTRNMKYETRKIFNAIKYGTF